MLVSCGVPPTKRGTVVLPLYLLLLFLILGLVRTGDCLYRAAVGRHGDILDAVLCVDAVFQGKPLKLRSRI